MPMSRRCELEIPKREKAEVEIKIEVAVSLSSKRIQKNSKDG